MKIAFDDFFNKCCYRLLQITVGYYRFVHTGTSLVFSQILWMWVEISGMLKKKTLSSIDH